MMTVPDTRIEIEDIGCIERLLLPSGWICEAQDSLAVFSKRDSLTCFSPRNTRAKFSIFLSAKPNHTLLADAARQIFALPTGHLQQTDLESISSLVRGAEDCRRFQPSKLALELWNSRKVLIISGTWLQSKEELFWILVDSDGTGERLQEVLFMAPEEDYSSHLLEVMFSFKSIRWKQTGA